MLIEPIKKTIRQAARMNRGKLGSSDIRAILDGDRDSPNIDRRFMETIKQSINMYPTLAALFGSLALWYFHIDLGVIILYALFSFISIRVYTKKAMRKWLEELLLKAEESKQNKSAINLYTKRFPVYIDLKMLSDAPC